MNARHWTCADTARHMASYRFGELEPALAEQLFEHALGCDHCYREHWQPFQEEKEFLTGLFLESLLADGRSAGEGGSTIDGDAPALTLSEWTSTVDLHIPSVAAQPDVRVGAEPAETAETVEGPHLRHIGTLLPRVPKRALVAGYQLYLGDGPLRPEETPRTSACLVVEANGDDDLVFLEALRDDVMVDGAALARYQRRALLRYHLVELSGTIFLFQKTNRVGKGRIGAGLLRHSGRAWALPSSGLTIGRGEDMDLRLPDRQVSTNLSFRPHALQAIGDPVDRERAAHLTLDAVEVSRRHAMVRRAQNGGLELLALSRHPVYVSRDGGWSAATEGQPSPQVRHGDEMLIGQMLLEYRER